MKRINMIKEYQAICSCELLGEFEKNLRELANCPVGEIESLALVTSRTINNIETTGRCTTNLAAFILELYADYFGVEFYLSDFLDFTINAIQKGKTICFVSSFQHETEDVVIDSSKECLVLKTNIHHLHPHRMTVPNDRINILVRLCRFDALNECGRIGRFEEELRLLCRLTMETVQEKTHIARNTIHGVEQGYNSRCITLAELFEYYFDQLHYEFSMKTFLEEIYEAVSQRKSLKAVLIDPDLLTSVSGIIAKEHIVLKNMIHEKIRF